MPSKKKSHKKLLLSLVIATTIPGAHAASGWDCTQTSEGWSCSAAEPSAAQSTSTTSSEPSPTTDLTVSDSSLPEASKAAAVKAPETLEPQSEPESMPVTLIKSEVDKQDAVPSETKNDYVAQAKLGESNKSADKVAMPVVTALPPQPTANIPDETVEHTIASSAHSVPSVSGSYMNLDWLHLSPIDAEGLVCKGVYREPEIWSEILTPGIAKSATTIDANRSSTVLGGLSELEGEVVIKQSGRQIESEYAQFDSKNRQALLRNNVRYREPGFLLRADTISADLDSSVAIANESSYVLHENELRGEALALTRYADRSIETQNSLITFCEPGNNDWAIRAQEMTLYPEEGFGESWHTRFEVAGVPVFYLPYFYFPLDDTRRSGFLYPSLSQDKENGFDLALPYYFNIAPNIDDTLTARLIEKRGLMLENEARYLNDFSMNQLSTGWMPSDDIYNQERWALSFDHRGNPAPGWGTHVDFTRVSDDDYFDDLAPVELRLPVKDDLNQSATVSYSASTWSASALVNDYQTIDGGSKPYARMPQLTLSGAETLGDTRLAYLGQYTDFTHETNTDGQRTHLRPTLTYDWNRTWGFLRPELGLWRSDYNLSNGTSPSATANFASLDSGLIFERQGELATQTLEPRIKLIHVGGDDTQSLQNFDSSGLGFSAGSLFDTLGYSGNDRVAHTDQATLGLTSRIFSLTGRELISVGVAQAHYFEDHDPRPGDSSGTEDRSDYAIGASWRPSDALKLSHDSRIDKDDGTLLAQNYGLLYHPDPGKLLYSSFRQTKSAPSNVTLEQIDIAAKWPLSPVWSLVGRYTEDLKASENLETLLGVEYGSCCWKIRFTGQRSVVDGSSDFERDNTFYLQFVLKGLGTLGGAEGREFLRDLTGFDEDANENF